MGGGAEAGRQAGNEEKAEGASTRLAHWLKEGSRASQESESRQRRIETGRRGSELVNTEKAGERRVAAAQLYGLASVDCAQRVPSPAGDFEGRNLSDALPDAASPWRR